MVRVNERKRRKELFVEAVKMVASVLNVKHNGKELFCIWPVFLASQVDVRCLPKSLKKLEQAVWDFIDYTMGGKDRPDWLIVENEEKGV